MQLGWVGSVSQQELSEAPHSGQAHWVIHSSLRAAAQMCGKRHIAVSAAHQRSRQP